MVVRRVFDSAKDPEQGRCDWDLSARASQATHKLFPGKRIFRERITRSAGTVLSIHVVTFVSLIGIITGRRVLFLKVSERKRCLIAQSD